MLRLLVLSLVLTLSSVFGEKRYDNYSLYKVFPKNADHLKLLQDLQENDDRFDFWSDPVALIDHVTILSSPQHKSEFESILKSNHVNFEISLANIQEQIDKERKVTHSSRNIVNLAWDHYYNLTVIYNWIDSLIAAHPDLVTGLVGGTTFEGREIRGLKISHGEGRKAIFLEGGIHSRELISPSAVTYIANELLTSEDEDTKAAAKDYDWYIFPVTNPDGYVWVFEQNRMWRKNRRPIGEHFGVDLNRNWNNNWLASGASTNPARDDYAGAGPFSEPETRTLSMFIESIGDQIDMYISFHSFSQLLLLPFGNTTQPLANYADAITIGRRAMGGLSVRYGTQYVTGNVAEAIYLATGGSIDWVKERLQVPLVYCYELRDNGTYGFLLPTEQIIPNNLETMDSLLELIYQAKRLGYLIPTYEDNEDSSGYGVAASFTLVVMGLMAKLLQDW